MLPVAIKFLSDVAIPLGQGQVFNRTNLLQGQGYCVAIPLGQGQVFNQGFDGCLAVYASQSLWVRDSFLIQASLNPAHLDVAIPLGQGQFFNEDAERKLRKFLRRNPFGSGTVF